MQVEPNIVISEFIVGMNDDLYHQDNSNVNIVEKARKQAESLARFEVPYYVLTNGSAQAGEGNLHIEHVELFEYPRLTLYFYRILMAFDFLQAHPEIKKVALTDAGDVTMLNYPFDDIEEGKLYMGDETSSLYDTRIVIENDNPQYMQDFIYENGHLPILNLGIMAGTRDTLIEYLGIMAKLITDEEVKIAKNIEGAQLGNFEMAISNYVAYRYFNDRLVHGRKVGTIFHGEQSISGAWFKHK